MLADKVADFPTLDYHRSKDAARGARVTSNFALPQIKKGQIGKLLLSLKNHGRKVYIRFNLRFYVEE